jgi:electron transport complex protein RnfB
MRDQRPRVALIDEARCIGCARCLDACPVDAIVGASGWMHTVIAPLCIGCDLCLPPCPVDCIAMVPAAARSAADAVAAKARAAERKRRLARLAPRSRPDRRAVLAAVLARARRR